MTVGPPEAEIGVIIYPAAQLGALHGHPFSRHPVRDRDWAAACARSRFARWRRPAAPGARRSWAASCAVLLAGVSAGLGARRWAARAPAARRISGRRSGFPPCPSATSCCFRARDRRRSGPPSGRSRRGSGRRCDRTDRGWVQLCRSASTPRNFRHRNTCLFPQQRFAAEIFLDGSDRWAFRRGGLARPHARSPGIGFSPFSIQVPKRRAPRTEVSDPAEFFAVNVSLLLVNN